MKMSIWIRILLLGLFSTYNWCPVTCVDCRTDTCHIHDGITDCSSQKLSCIPCNLATASVLKLTSNIISSLNQGDFHCFENLKAIDLSYNRINTIADMTFRNMTEQSKISLRYLNLQHNKLSIIQGKPFEGLSNLRTLDLSFNQIHTIASKSFKGLSNLLNLLLRNNTITSLNGGDFDGLSMLQTLDLGNNEITVLDSTPFQGLDSLRILNLDHNSLTIIPNVAFKNKRASENASLPILILDLSFNQINAFEDFGVLRNLQILKLIGNQITELKERSFNCFKLEELHLESNELSDVQHGAFKILGQLQSLFMNDNALYVITRQMFEGLSNLQTLEIQNNKIRTLGANAFENIARLRSLRIDHNKIAALNTQPFNNLKKLQHLDLGYNNLESIGNNCFSNCSKLEHLKLNDNMLSSITHDAFADTVFTELQYFHLSNNRIESVANTSLHGMKNIRYMHLDNNYIHELQDSTFKELHRLEFLYLQHNELITLSEKTFGGLYGLQYLDVSFNNLQALKSTIFKDNSALKTLSISKNQISHLANATFAPLVYLNALYAEGNMIDKIQCVNFGHLSRLKTLHLDQNSITLIEESALTGLKSLVKLHLRSNKIKAFPSQVLPELQSLITVDLRENEIVTLQPPSINQSFDFLLAGNPFSCDCAMKELKQWLSKSKKTQYLVCNQPENLRGDDILSLELEAFQCIAPYFTKISHDLRAEVGDDVRMFCRVDGFPEPVLKWFDVRNFEIQTSLNTRQRYEINTIGILDIKNVSLNDAGVYTCTASNPGGREDGKIMLNVVERAGSKAGVIGGGLFAIILVVGVGFGLYMYLWSYKRKRLVTNTDENNDQAYMSVSIRGFPTEREGGSQGSIHSEVVYATIGAGERSEENKINEKEEHCYQRIWKPPVIKVNEESSENEPVKKALRSHKPGSPGYMTMLPMKDGEDSDERDVQPSSSTLATTKFIKHSARKTVSARFESRVPKAKEKLHNELKIISNVATLRTRRENAIHDSTLEKTKTPKPLYAYPEGKIKRHVQQLESKSKKGEEERSVGADKSCTMPRLRVDSAGSRAKEPITVGSRPRRGSASKIEFTNKMYDSVVK